MTTPSLSPASDELMQALAAKRALQQPTYTDQEALAAVQAELTRRQPIVSIKGINQLKKDLARVATGQAILIQGGDCAESLNGDVAGNAIALQRTLHHMKASVQEQGMGAVMVARIGGQSAKPRSADTETRDGVTLPSYRGDMVNSEAFTVEARVPNPDNMLKAHELAIKTAEVLRGHSNKVYKSHEGLLLPFELAMTRQDQQGKHYATSTHMMWIGDRTRDPNDAHVEHCSRIENPVGIKCGPTMDPKDLDQLIKKLDPNGEPGRLTLIVRMGKQIQTHLPRLLAVVKKSGKDLVVVSDPMHGNTVTAPSGHKTRHMGAIMNELTSFTNICREHGVHPGGVHLEMTGYENVTECVGAGVNVSDLPKNFGSLCDPRLNADQAKLLAKDLPMAQRPGGRMVRPYDIALAS